MKHTTGNGMPIAGLTSDSKHTTNKRETECQSLDLHQTPHTTNTQRKPNANRWTYIRLQAHNKLTGNRMPIAGLTSDSKHTTNKRETEYQSLDLYQTPHTHTKGYQTDKPIGSLELEPNNCQANAHKKKRLKKKKGARRDLARSPAYVPHLV